ncbi:hypothetical protein Ancab_023088 [Ancistrocladus abbreviatus]
MKIPACDGPPLPTPGCKELVVGAEQNVMGWPRGAFVAQVHDVDIIPSLQQRMRQEGFLHWNMWHMEGDLILLSSLSADLTHSLLLEGSGGLAKPEALPEETKEEASSQMKAELEAAGDRRPPELHGGNWRRLVTT